MELEFEIENPPIVDAVVVPGRQGLPGTPGPNIVTVETSTNLHGVLVADGERIREANPGEVLNEEAMQAALLAHRVEVFARTSNPGIEGVEWNNSGRPQFSNGPVYVSPFGGQFNQPNSNEYLVPNE